MMMMMMMMTTTTTMLRIIYNVEEENEKDDNVDIAEDAVKIADVEDDEVKGEEHDDVENDDAEEDKDDDAEDDDVEEDHVRRTDPKTGNRTAADQLRHPDQAPAFTLTVRTPRCGHTVCDYFGSESFNSKRCRNGAIMALPL